MTPYALHPVGTVLGHANGDLFRRDYDGTGHDWSVLYRGDVMGEEPVAESLSTEELPAGLFVVGQLAGTS